MCSRSAWLTACSCALAVALGGCGGSKRAAPQPKLPRLVAERLISQARLVETNARAGDPCVAHANAERLRDSVRNFINSGRVPAALQEPLMSSANDLATRLPACLLEPSPPAENEHHDKGHGKHKGKGKKHGGEGD